jgi:hypothetical protein
MNDDAPNAERFRDLRRVLRAGAKRVTSWPRCTEICLIAFAMRSTAIRKYPAAICSGRGSSPVAAPMSRASAAKAAVVAEASSGSSALLPNTRGKNSG